MSSFYIELIDDQPLVCLSYFPCCNFLVEILLPPCAGVIWTVLLTTGIMVNPLSSFSVASCCCHIWLTPLFPPIFSFEGSVSCSTLKGLCPKWCSSLSWSLAILCFYLNEQIKSKTKRHMLLDCNPAGSDFSYPCLCCSVSFLVSTVSFCYFTMLPYLLSHLCATIIKSFIVPLSGWIVHSLFFSNYIWHTILYLF